MPFPGFCLPLSLPAFFIGLTVASGSLGCKDSHPASSLSRHLLPLDLQALLLNLAPALEPSSFMVHWSCSLKSNLWPCPHPAYHSCLSFSVTRLKCPPGLLISSRCSEAAKWFGVCATNLWDRAGSSLYHQPALSNPSSSMSRHFKKYLSIYLAALGLSCSTCDHCVVWDLVPWPGMEPKPTALGAWSLSHWTTREVPPDIFICQLWVDKIHSDYIQMCKEKTVVSLLTDDSSEFAHKLPTLLGNNWIGFI